MKIYIIIPAHNEEDNIAKTIQSLVNQQLKPTRLIVVNDNSSDQTSEIVNRFRKQHPWIELNHKKSSDKHLPGAKIIEAFYHGYDLLDENYDLICKFDADIVFYKNDPATNIRNIVFDPLHVIKNGEIVF